ncbi:TetR/AcrR family transcriptional regulator [Massilia sp. TWP1-3-3]|uniref:TetR/AcrR family transcriptional regulator n=1 Tax=Massilia sp. TWP1-3-3 TaxID=2804573 RepID=UPI003CF7C3A6
MARPRNFEEDVVVAQAADVFGRLGFNAASIADLVTATGLQRGSLYKAFGSKQNLFRLALAGALTPGWSKRAASIDLLIIALKELAPGDGPVTDLCRAAVSESGDATACLLGARLLEHLDSKGTPHANA